MDFSNKYIVMCESAVELQQKWNVASGDAITYKDGDRYSTPRFKEFRFFDAITDWHKDHAKNNGIWLPRQDQLQQIVFEFWDYNGNFKTKHLAILDDFEEFAIEDHEDWVIDTNSFEQLWLCYIMYVLYKKKWDGINWIKI